MDPVRVDIRHHSHDEIRSYLADAQRLVHEAELDGDLKVPAFLKAVELLAGKQVTLQQREVVPVPAGLGSLRM